MQNKRQARFLEPCRHLAKQSGEQAIGNKPNLEKESIEDVSPVTSMIKAVSRCLLVVTRFIMFRMMFICSVAFVGVWVFAASKSIAHWVGLFQQRPREFFFGFMSIGILTVLAISIWRTRSEFSVDKKEEYLTPFEHYTLWLLRAVVRAFVIYMSVTFVGGMIFQLVSVIW